ncbi:16295_t:CDS:2, partial [Racocetra persica]
LNNQFIANFEKCKANARTTFSLGLTEKSTEDFEECENNTRTIFSLGLGSSLEVSEDICESLSLELGIVKDNSCIGLKVSEVNTRSTFSLKLELEGGMDLESNNKLYVGLTKDKSGLGLEVRENSKGLVKSNGSVNSNLELAESRSSMASDFGSGSVHSLSFEK